MDSRLEKKLAEYEDFFGESFPTFNFMHLSEDEIADIVESCLDSGKDAYELGYAKDDEDLQY